MHGTRAMSDSIRRTTSPTLISAAGRARRKPPFFPRVVSPSRWVTFRERNRECFELCGLACTLATMTHSRRLVTTISPYLLRYFATCSPPATVWTSSSGALISRTLREGTFPSASGSSALDFLVCGYQRAVREARANAVRVNNAAHFRFELFADEIEKIGKAGIVGCFLHSDAAYVRVAQVREKLSICALSGNV